MQIAGEDFAETEYRKAVQVPPGRGGWVFHCRCARHEHLPALGVACPVCSVGIPIEVRTPLSKRSG